MDRQNVDLHSHNLELRAKSNSNSRLKTRVKKTSKSNTNISGGEGVLVHPRAETTTAFFLFRFFRVHPDGELPEDRKKRSDRDESEPQPKFLSTQRSLARSLLYIH